MNWLVIPMRSGDLGTVCSIVICCSQACFFDVHPCVPNAGCFTDPVVR